MSTSYAIVSEARRRAKDLRHARKQEMANPEYAESAVAEGGWFLASWHWAFSFVGRDPVSQPRRRQCTLPLPLESETDTPPRRHRGLDPTRSSPFRVALVTCPRCAVYG